MCNIIQANDGETIIAAQISDNWSTAAKQYAAMSSKGSIVFHFSELAADLLVQHDLSSLFAGGTLLDVCAGPAVFSVAVMSNLGVDCVSSTKFIISDFSAGMLEAAKVAVESFTPSRPNTEFRLIDVQNIELPSESIDVVGCMFGYFVSDRLKAFSEVCRVCQPGGIAVIGTFKHAGLAFVFADFLTFLGVETLSPASMKMVHSCADGDSLRCELLSLGFSTVVIHEKAHVFDIPLEGESLSALLSNPMIKTQLDAFSTEFVHAEWARFARQPGMPYPFDRERNVLLVEYVANIAIAIK